MMAFISAEQLACVRRASGSHPLRSFSQNIISGVHTKRLLPSGSPSIEAGGFEEAALASQICFDKNMSMGWVTSRGPPMRVFFVSHSSNEARIPYGFVGRCGRAGETVGREVKRYLVVVSLWREGEGEGER